MQNLQANAAEQLKNQEAESAFVRKKLWGASETGTSEASESDEMGHTILGDITHPAPIIMPQPQQSSLPTVVALIATLGLGAAAGYILNNKPAPPAVEQSDPSFDDSTISIGLGRIEDYIAEGEGQ